MGPWPGTKTMEWCRKLPPTVYSNTHTQIVETFDGADLGEPGVQYVTLRYDNDMTEDLSWPEMQLTWVDNGAAISTRNRSLAIVSVHEQLLHVLKNSEALQELSNNSQPLAASSGSGGKRARGTHGVGQ